MMRHAKIQSGLVALIVCSLGLLLWPSAGARAEDAGRLSALRIMVWPEYDDPGVLVQYEGELGDASGLPRDVMFYMPSGAELNAAAYFDASGKLVNTDSPRIQDGGAGFARLTVKLPASRFHLEYYYNPLPATPEKSLDFVYKAAQPAEQVRVEILQPLKSEQFTTDPPATIEAAGFHDFKNHILDFSSVQADQLLEVQIHYLKTSPEPSVASLPQPAAQPASAEAAAASNALVPAGIGAGVLALGALGGYAWLKRRPPAPRPARGAAQNPRRKHHSHGGGATGYCPQCGRALASDHHFCPECGARRRGKAASG